VLDPKNPESRTQEEINRVYLAYPQLNWMMTLFARGEIAG